MKKLLLLTVCTSVAIFGCAVDATKHGKSEIFGKINVIDENGRNITEFCTSQNMNSNGFLIKKAVPGDNTLGQITCTPGQYMYRIKPATDVTVSVPSDGVAVYFGDVTITLDSSGYAVKNTGNGSKDLYKGTLPVKKGSLKVGSSEKDWVKNFMGSTRG